MILLQLKKFFNNQKLLTTRRSLFGTGGPIRSTKIVFNVFNFLDQITSLGKSKLPPGQEWLLPVRSSSFGRQLNYQFAPGLLPLRLPLRCSFPWKHPFAGPCFTWPATNCSATEQRPGNRKRQQKISHAPRVHILTSSDWWPLALQGEELDRGATAAAAVIIMGNANTSVVFRGVTCWYWQWVRPATTAPPKAIKQ